MFDIDWEKFRGLNFHEGAIIRNSSNCEPSDNNYRHNNFELLAVEIVHQLTNVKWEHTKWAADFNHDAYALVSLYRDNNKKKWWLEAKYSYSNDSKKITRYRLDATIVSKLLEEKSQRAEGGKATVSKIFFFTNAAIPWKVKTDISNALKAMKKNCTAVFYEREDIEFWLYCHKDVYKTYFNDSLSEETETNHTFYISKKIEILPSYYKFLNYRYVLPDCIKLVYGTTYIVTMNIYKEDKSELQVRVPKGIKLVSQPQRTASNNFIEFKIKICDKPNNPLSFNINGQKTEPIQFTYEKREQLDIASHKNIMCAVREFTASNAGRACSTLLILGKNATGKTDMLHHIMEETTKQNFFISFDYDAYTNIIYLCRFLYHLFLPYIDYEDIDEQYITELKRTRGFGFELLEDLRAFIGYVQKKKDDEKKLEEKISQLRLIFPQNIPHNENILFIDNIQRLSNADGAFFRKILSALDISSFSVKIIAFGNTFFQDNNFYNDINSRKLPISDCGYGELLCEVTMDDVIKNLNRIFNANIRLEFKHQIFTDIFEINEFIKYVKTNEICIKDTNSFLLEFSRYKNCDEAISAIQEYINKSLHKCNALCKSLMEEIYYAPETVPYIVDDESNERRAAKETLLGMNLIKSSITGNKLEPYHETYRNIYMRYCDERRHADFSTVWGKQEGLIVDFNFSNSQEKRKETAKILCQLPHKFPSTVLYALEPMFARVDDLYEKLIRVFGEDLFFSLFHAYAVACAYNSTNVTSSSQHEKIIRLAEKFESYSVRSIALVSRCEQLNSKFDSLRLVEAKKYYEDFLDQYNQLAFYFQDDAEWKIRRLLAQSIDIYIKCTEDDICAEREFLELRKQYVKLPIKSLHHFLDCTARFAQLLYVSDIEKAYKYTRQSYLLLYAPRVSTDDKQRKEISFQMEYIEMLRDGAKKHLPELLKKYNDFGNGFRVKQQKVRCAMLSASLLFDDYKTANFLLESEIQTIRPRRMRLDMFFKQALALYSLKVEKNSKKALKMLHEANKLVKAIPTYSRIITHNIQLLQRTATIPNRFAFALSYDLNPNVYYIDPRADR